MINYKKDYLELLKSHFKDLSKESLADKSFDELIDENLLSPFIIELPKSTFAKIDQFLQAFYSLKENSIYQQQLFKKYNPTLIDPGNKSLFMSYDFHLDNNQDPKLIEINTNAAFLALGFFYYQLRALPLATSFDIHDLKLALFEELNLFGKKNEQPQILIIDEEPKTQRLYSEFLVYQNLFKSFGWDCSIADYRDLKNYSANLVYNRWTDFYFEKPESAFLKECYLNKKLCFSPNPFEYFLQSDKQRLVDIHAPNFLSGIPITDEQKLVINKTIPITKRIADFNKEDLWLQRKKMFFKPVNSFGSKQTYKGASISKKLFDELNPMEFLAQEYVNAPEKVFETPQGKESFKFDLRCYAYKNKLQMIIARVYKGQVTNLKTTYGGFAPIKWS